MNVLVACFAILAAGGAPERLPDIPAEQELADVSVFTLSARPDRGHVGDSIQLSAVLTNTSSSTLTVLPHALLDRVSWHAGVAAGDELEIAPGILHGGAVGGAFIDYAAGNLPSERTPLPPGKSITWARSWTLPAAPDTLHRYQVEFHARYCLPEPEESPSTEPKITGCIEATAIIEAWQ
jgi:hypothetical protein